jgi:hypothetical protein
MGLNTRIGKVADATAAALVITWTANEPTAANTQTIADGTVPTVAELGQAVQNLNTILTQVLADNAAMLAQLNAGE